MAGQHYIAPGKPMQNAFIESFMYRRPRGCKRFLQYFGYPVGCVHVSGLLLRPMPWPLALMEMRRPHQRVALVALKALRACSIPSSAGVHHAVICPHTIRWPTYTESQAASLGR